ncbi:hypothetical protein niasHT_027988 [Heterodera trifolii]|uniref:N-terminal kinase-like protein n=1 Tax=Heterodera trifolii TaxID=157864 RepID=A0ABD2KEJ7_9BILA
MSSVLSSLFSRDPKASFPFELPSDSFTTIQQEIFVGKSFKKSDSSEKATCFWSCSPSSTLKAQAQKLKTLRHPNVLTFVDSLETDSAFFLITEPCRPLDYYLGQTSLNSTQRELFVSWGLYQVLNCLKFLHNEAKISHNNLRNAIFVTESGDWKLASFHLSGTFSSPQCDLNDLADTLNRIFRPNSSADSTQLPKRVQPLFRWFNARGRSVMAVADILNECRSVGGFMKNKFVDTLLFLDEFQLRDAAERQSFFVQLNSNLDLFPDDISRNKILPKLIHTYEFGDAGAHILVPMFKLGRLLDENEYQQRIVPCLVKLFSSTDRTTRVKLLERIDEFSSHLRPQVVNEKIYGNLITGFMDSNSAVRESTVKAIVSFADKLNHSNLNTDLMKHLARLQGSDPEPSIRTNTTICLGKIGCFIDPSHRQRILISAFTRALKDPFPPARMAGVIALSATQQYYFLAEVAQRVLPSLAPLAIDPDKQVRDQSFKAMNGFLEKLQKASESPELIPELEAQVKAGGKGGLLGGDKVPQWAGWAIKAISGKFYKASTPPAQPDQQQSRTEVAKSEMNGPEKERHGTAAKEEADRATTALPREESFSSSHSSAKGTNSTLAEGWGELVDEEDENETTLKGMDREKNAITWVEETDEWEAGETTSVQNAELITTQNAKTNTMPNISTSSSPVTLKPTKGTTSLKLGAVKKPSDKAKANDNLLDLLLDLNIGEENSLGKKSLSNVADAKELKRTANSSSTGNFASVATQMAQQRRNEQQKKEQQKGEESAAGRGKKEEEGTRTDWQSW